MNTMQPDATENQSQPNFVMATVDTLPRVGAPFCGGTFVGITTTREGEHVAAVLLPGSNVCDWRMAEAWAASSGGQLPSRTVAAMIYANLPGHLQPRCYWTQEQYDALYACVCGFDNGNQLSLAKGENCVAVAVILIPLV